MQRKILILKSGLLGDTLVALPALNCLREAFPQAKIIYVWQRYNNSNFVTPVEILDGSGLVDEFRCYPLSKSVTKSFWNYLRLWLFCTLRDIDVGIVLEPPYWSAVRKKFFRLCGIEEIVGPNGDVPTIVRDKEGFLTEAENITDQLLGLLQVLGVDLPEVGEGRFDLHLSDDEKQNAQTYLDSNQISAKPLIAVAPCSNMSSKCWPRDNYLRVVSDLITRFDVTPMVFGAAQDYAVGQSLIEFWGRGVNAAGALSVREGVAVLSHCLLYLGNDTGTMHMAVAAGIKCVAIFSSIDMPGRWYPYGKGHVVFRKQVNCEGCLKRDCNSPTIRCIDMVACPEVFDACCSIIQEL